MNLFTNARFPVLSRLGESLPSRLRQAFRTLTPSQVLLGGFAVLTFAGAYLLTLPIASARHTPTPFIDAFFTASSGITTTGLIVVDTGSHYSLFGQVVILTLFQIGGLGYMAFIALAAYLLGSKLSLRSHLTIQESLAGAMAGELRAFIGAVFLFTIFFEAAAAVVLAAFWARQFPLATAIYAAIFHAVSAFSTAGFSLFADSFTTARDSALVNLTIAAVTIAGGIGFFVLRDVSNHLLDRLRGARPRRMSVHTKVTIALSAALMIAGTLMVFFAERWSPELSFRQRSLAASFQALSASTTTGFNTVDIGTMTEASLFVLIVLMFVGASPGGTGGGIKTTTFGVVLASAGGLLRGGQDTVLFGRRLPLDTIYRALTIGMLWTLVITIDTLVLSLTEEARFVQVLFEVVSALGTVGLSMGITADLSVVGKVVISLTMLLGRIGPLAVGFALVGRPRRVLVRYAKEAVFVG